MSAVVTKGLLWTVVLLAGVRCLLAADESPAPVPHIEIHGPNVRPGYPDAFPLGYKLADDSMSPDGKYAVISPNLHRISYELARDFLVALKPFRFVAVNEAETPYDIRNTTFVEWAKDNSAVVVTVEGKWGPVGFTLFELQDGRVKRQTNLYAEIVRLLEPAFHKARVEPWNDLSHFNFVGGEKERGEGAHLESDGRQIRFDVDATNNPKPMEPPVKKWSGHFEGTWSIPEARWLTRKVTSETYRG
jgi:hypothetical protein